MKLLKNNQTHNATLLIGSNLGDSQTLIEQARGLIQTNVGVIIQQTQLLKNEPVGFISLHPFFNQIVVAKTPLTPHQLIDALEDIERTLGRTKPCCDWRKPRQYADRTMDIDILFYGDLNISDQKLEIPHPKIKERDFVLKLLQELN